MIRKITLVMILLALCAPVLAVDTPNMVGNWTGTVHGVAWGKNTDYQTTGKPEYFDGHYILKITEQNGTRFSGRFIYTANPLNSEVVLGVIGSDNKTIAMVDEDNYYWGSINSSTEMELFRSVVDMEQMVIREITFTKK